MGDLLDEVKWWRALNVSLLNFILEVGKPSEAGERPDQIFTLQRSPGRNGCWMNWREEGTPWGLEAQLIDSFISRARDDDTGSPKAGLGRVEAEGNVDAAATWFVLRCGHHECEEKGY